MITLLLTPVYTIADLIGLYSLLAGHKKWALCQFITLILMFIPPLTIYIGFAKIFLCIIGFFVVYLPSIKKISEKLKK